MYWMESILLQWSALSELQMIGSYLTFGGEGALANG